MFTLLLPLASLCLAQAAQKPLQEPTLSIPLTADFTALAHKTLAHFHVPALSIAVLHNSTLHTAGYGTAVFPNTSATPETLYYVGSTTKSFTAAALSLLMDDLANTSSSFSWKTPVVDLLRDDFVLADEYVTSHATLEDLASHRTGFPRHDLSYGTAGHRTVRDTVRNMRHLPSTAGFREAFQYCNYMWATLGHVVETLTGGCEGAFLRQRLWRVLGMTSTYWSLAEVRDVEGNEERLARGYTWDEATGSYYTDPYLDIGPLAGAGSMISTVLDYAKYLEMMLARSGPLSDLAHTNLRRARSFQSPDIYAPYNGVQSYTLGWDLEPYRGVNIISHNGGLYGFGAQMAYVPELGFAVAMLANTAGTSNYVEQVLLFRLLDDLLGVAEADRFDWVKKYDGVMAKGEKELQRTREDAFGGTLPEKKLQPSLAIEEYEGQYWSDGYKWLNFSVATASPRIPGLEDKEKKVLRASVMDRVWPGYIELEHVSGEFFVAWVVTPKGEEKSDGKDGEGEGLVAIVGSGSAAEFRIGADGRPAELGIAFEDLMKGEKIWFNRV